MSRYFDNAATTPLDPRVAEAMRPWLGESFGNPSSLHSWGRAARAAIETAREQCAEFLGADDPSEIIFTSGATESNNWILNLYRERASISPFEHSSLWETGLALGCGVLENDSWILKGENDLLSVMRVNNETGAILDFPADDLIRHSDLTQAAGKIPTNVEGLDFASLSAHKIHGPQGIGLLYARGGLIEPWIRGGEQEASRRAGTHNVAGIVGLGAACQIAAFEQQQNHAHAEDLREIAWSGLSALSDIRQNTHSSNSPFILSVSILGLEGEALVVDLDARGFAISSGAACSSRSNEPSHVLTALGIEPEWLRGTVRISFSKLNDRESAQGLAQSIVESVHRLRRKG